MATVPISFVELGARNSSNTPANSEHNVRSLQSTTMGVGAEPTTTSLEPGNVESLETCNRPRPEMEERSSCQPGWKRLFRQIVYTIAFVLYVVYFGFATALNFERAIPLVVVTCLAALLLTRHIGKFVLKRLKQRSVHIAETSPSPEQCREQEVGKTEGGGRGIKTWKTKCPHLAKFLLRGRKTMRKTKVKMFCYLLTVLAICGFLVIQHVDQPSRLRPMLGLAVIVLVSWLVSYNRGQINWRPVVWGLALQMVLGLLTLRTRPGRESFQFLGEQMEKFLEHVLAGVLFVFGEKYHEFFFVFKLMPIVIFLSAALATLYHLGIMQKVVGLVAQAMELSMGTTAAETTGTVACIFLGQPEASLTIRPFLSLMTRSELFAITAAGFASVTADVFAIFVHYGMPSSHIITAVLMSAPASIAVSKIICPEMEVSQTKNRKQLRSYEKQMPRHRSVLEAAVQGAQDAVPIIVSVIATIIAFLSILSFINSVINYLGTLVNVEGLSLEKLVSYPLMPVAYLLGVAWEDCRPVAEVIGLKTFVNELVAYQRLNEIVEGGGIKMKVSEVIAMYALCGFSNPTTMGITVGGLSAMVPQKKEILLQIILMSWLAGSLACFMTAAWAGLLYTEESTNRFYNTTD